MIKWKWLVPSLMIDPNIHNWICSSQLDPCSNSITPPCLPTQVTEGGFLSSSPHSSLFNHISSPIFLAKWQLWIPFLQFCTIPLLLQLVELLKRRMNFCKQAKRNRRCFVVTLTNYERVEKVQALFIELQDLINIFQPTSLYTIIEQQTLTDWLRRKQWLSWKVPFCGLNPH